MSEEPTKSGGKRWVLVLMLIGVVVGYFVWVPFGVIAPVVAHGLARAFFRLR